VLSWLVLRHHFSLAIPATKGFSNELNPMLPTIVYLAGYVAFASAISWCIFPGWDQLDWKVAYIIASGGLLLLIPLLLDHFIKPVVGCKAEGTVTTSNN
jgi:hypothetical protein